MKELHFPILTCIDVNVKELDITTTTLIDIGSEVTFFQDFLLPKLNGKNFNLIAKLELRVSILQQHI